MKTAMTNRHDTFLPMMLPSISNTKHTVSTPWRVVEPAKVVIITRDGHRATKVQARVDRITGQTPGLTAWRLLPLVLEIGSSRLLLESTGWLVAHRKSRMFKRLSPAHFHWSTLSGESPSDHSVSSGEQEWGSWGLMLLRKAALPADNTTDEPQ
jgi:hypothetical protein